MNEQMRAHLEVQGIRVGATTIEPCWACRDKDEYERERAAQPPPNYRYHLYWHPWHDGKTEMPEWNWLQRLAFRLHVWTPPCYCRACNGSGETLCTHMQGPQ